MSLKKLEVHHVTKRIHGNIVLQDISCTFLAGENLWLKRNQWIRKNDAHAFIVRFDSSVRGRDFL